MSEFVMGGACSAARELLPERVRAGGKKARADSHACSACGSLGCNARRRCRR
jgi:hypothetical protein